MPKRIQRCRTKAWRMPPNCVYVGRPSRWGNPFQVHCHHDVPAWWLGCVRFGNPTFVTVKLDSIEEVVAAYRMIILRLTSDVGDRDDDPLDLSALRGLDLCCWCPLDQPCHADVLLELANR